MRTMASRARSRASEGLRRRLAAALERTSGVSPVIVPEFTLNPRPRWGWEQAAPPALAAIIAGGEAEYEAAIDAALSMEEWSRSIPQEPGAAGGAEPAWRNDYWGGMDAVFGAAQLRHRDPRLYLEVGSGFSTRFARRVINDFALQTKIVSIDPQPRAQVDQLCDRVLRRPAEDVDPAVFDELRRGDVMLIDGSHMALMNSDATVLFVEVLPRLPAGVLVGIHDVFLPWDYPPTWERRFYGEQYLIAAFLLGGASHWAIQLPAWYVTRLSSLGERLAPLWPLVETRFGRVANSFWIERVS